MSDSEGMVRVADVEVRPGRKKRFDIPIARLTTGTQVALPVMVVNGRSAGRRMWLSAAIHGDELNGIEIIRRVLERLDPATMSGSLVAVPIVNVFGFITRTRYLPDRRDLNRSFPGSKSGSLAARIAHLFLDEIVSQCEYGIDLHTGSDGRTNLPQVRANLDDRETARCAEAFGAPVLIHARVRDGSLREAATSAGCHALVYEGGEAARFDPFAIDAGVLGVLRVMSALGIVNANTVQAAAERPRRFTQTTWLRARRSGIFRSQTQLGARVSAGAQVGLISDTFGERPLKVVSRWDGIVIGIATHPLVNRGDALVHVAEFESPSSAG